MGPLILATPLDVYVSPGSEGKDPGTLHWVQYNLAQHAFCTERARQPYLSSVSSNATEIRYRRELGSVGSMGHESESSFGFAFAFGFKFGLCEDDEDAEDADNGEGGGNMSSTRSCARV